MGNFEDKYGILHLAATLERKLPKPNGPDPSYSCSKTILNLLLIGLWTKNYTNLTLI